MVGKVEKTTSENEKHVGEVTSLVFHNEYLFSGGSDGLIKLWDKDLRLIKDIPAHEAHVYALAINANGELYSSSCDGTLKYLKDPIKSNEGQVIYHANIGEICSLFCSDVGILYSGDDKGIVVKFVDNKVEATYNLVEEVKSMAVEKNFLYTARDLDAVVTELMPGTKGNYGLKATVEGRAPLAVIGPIEDGRSKYLVFTTRDGKGVTLVRNGKTYPVIWRKDVSSLA